MQDMKSYALTDFIERDRRVSIFYGFYRKEGGGIIEKEW